MAPRLLMNSTATSSGSPTSGKPRAQPYFRFWHLHANQDLPDPMPSRSYDTRGIRARMLEAMVQLVGTRPPSTRCCASLAPTQTRAAMRLGCIETGANDVTVKL